MYRLLRSRILTFPFLLRAAGETMETLAESALLYLAIGTILFGLMPRQGTLSDLNWRSQAEAFRDSVPEVLGWPLALWRFCRNTRFPDGH